MATNIHIAARKNITKDSRMICLGIDLPNKLTLFLFFAIVKTVAIITAKVHVLMPPPVDPGEAQINIRNIIKISDGTVNCPISRVLNPAVLAVTD